jgi:hypothetical protein
MVAMPERPSLAAVRDGGGLALMQGRMLFYAIKGNRTGDFYSYNPETGAWTILELVPEGPQWKQVKTGGCIATDGVRNVYVVKGNNTLEFYRYPVDSFAWCRAPDVPLGNSGRRVKAADIVSAPVVGGAHLYFLKGVANEFFRYATSETLWYPLRPPSVQFGKWNRGSFLVYDGDHTIYAHKAKYHELWAYDMSADTWGDTSLPGMPFAGRSGRSAKSKDGACGVFFRGCIYALKGGNTQEFWSYDTATRRWTELETVPQYGSSGKRRKVKGGGDMAAKDSFLYALKGNKCRELWRYTVTDSTYGAQPPDRGAASGRMVNGEWLMAVSPNPVAAGFATLSITGAPEHLGAGARSISVLDISGRVVRQSAIRNLQSAMPLDIRSISAGVYLVRLSAPGFTATEKLIIQR